MKNSVKTNIKKLAFKVARNTVLKEVPEHVKDLFEQGLNSSKTKEIPFHHSKLNGLVLPPFMTEEQLRICTTFQTSPGDVFLVTYPKSGTTWIEEIVRCIAQAKDSGKEHLIGGTVLRFDLANHEQLEALPSPRYMSTHLPFTLVPRSSEHEVKYIYLARNPRDLAVSNFHFICSQPFIDFGGTWEEFLQHFIKGNVFFGSYLDHVLEWWSHKDDENVLFLKYEDLKKDLKSQVKIIAEFLGFKLSDEEAQAVSHKCTFQAMKSNPNLHFNKFNKIFKKEGSHLRKGVVGDWKNHFSDEQLAEFDKLYESRLKGTGLEFEF